MNWLLLSEHSQTTEPSTNTETVDKSLFSYKKINQNLKNYSSTAKLILKSPKINFDDHRYFIIDSQQTKNGW